MAHAKIDCPMSFRESMDYLDEQGFTWALLPHMFPSAPRDHSEGEWQKLVTKAAIKLATPEDQELLLDLLDAQLCVYCELCWVQSEKLPLPEGSYDDVSPFGFDAHIATNLLQINSNIRASLGLLRRKNGRAAMLTLGPDETIFDRICRTVHSADTQK